MEWRKLMVGGVAYGLGTTQIGIDRMRRAGLDVSHLEGALQAEKLRGRERGAQLPHVNFEDGSDTHEGHTIGSDSRRSAWSKTAFGSPRHGLHFVSPTARFQRRRRDGSLTDRCR
jgi:hypothetical protein